jgi:hypothetical protein
VVEGGAGVKGGYQGTFISTTAVYPPTYLPITLFPESSPPLPHLTFYLRSLDHFHYNSQLVIFRPNLSHLPPPAKDTIRY